MSSSIPPDRPTDAPATLFHVEEMETIYWRTAVDAPDAETARAAITSGRGIGEIIGKTIVDRRVSNVHPVTDRCMNIGCYDFDAEELIDDA